MCLIASGPALATPDGAPEGGRKTANSRQRSFLRGVMPAATLQSIPSRTCGINDVPRLATCLRDREAAHVALQSVPDERETRASLDKSIAGPAAGEAVAEIAEDSSRRTKESFAASSVSVALRSPIANPDRKQWNRRTRSAAADRRKPNALYACRTGPVDRIVVPEIETRLVIPCHALFSELRV